MLEIEKKIFSKFGNLVKSCGTPLVLFVNANTELIKQSHWLVSYKLESSHHHQRHIKRSWLNLEPNFRHQCENKVVHRQLLKDFIVTVQDVSGQIEMFSSN